MKIRYILLPCILSIVISSAFAPTPAMVAQSGTTSPESQGMDSVILADMLEEIQKDGMDLHTILIIRNSQTVLEKYYDPYGPEVRHTVESNTKSIMGALVGISIQEGLIRDENTNLIDYFPGRMIAQMDSQKRSITLKNLLTMTSGLDCEDQTQAANDMYLSSGWLQYLLDRPMVSKPGEKWAYCSGSVHLLSVVLQKSTGMEAREYANQKLFRPLGIADVQQNDWGVDPQGYSNGIAGLYLTPRELARFGQLYLHKGNWNGTQIIPHEWVEKSTTEQTYIGKSDYTLGMDRRFGYLFSIFPEKEYYGYLGRAGQSLFIFPKENMVVVISAGLPVGQEGQLLNLVNQYILASIQSTQALPENPAAAERLARLIKPAGDISKTARQYPVLAKDISGKDIVFEPNPYGWEHLSFNFAQNSSEAEVTFNQSVRYTMGMDGRYRMTDNPPGRPLGLKTRWLDDRSLLVSDIVLGEYATVEALFTFDGKQVHVSVKNLSFPDSISEFSGRVNDKP